MPLLRGDDVNFYLTAACSSVELFLRWEMWSVGLLLLINTVQYMYMYVTPYSWWFLKTCLYFAKTFFNLNNIFTGFQEKMLLCQIIIAHTLTSLIFLVMKIYIPVYIISYYLNRGRRYCYNFFITRKKW